MMHYLASLRTLKFAALSLALAAPLAAQNALYVEHGDAFHLVRKMAGQTPYIEEGSKLIPVSGGRLALKKVDDFIPVVVTVRNYKGSFASGSSFDSMLGGLKNFQFRAGLESPVRFDNVFVALDLNSENTGQFVFAQEVGRLAPRLTQAVEINAPLPVDFSGGPTAVYHIFVNGTEVFHSAMDPKFIEKAIDHMVEKYVENTKNSPPKPFIRPAPVYPESLRASYPSGRAVISFAIGADGRVIDPQVTSASDPAFGEAALTAIRQWRFMPRVKDGQAVEVKTELPFSFGPSAGKS